MIQLLAAASDQNPEDIGKSGPIGLVMTVLLLIAAAFLVKSMTAHLKRIPRTFDPDDDLPQVPDTADELLARSRPPGEELLDHLRRAPRAIEPPRPGNDRPGTPSPPGA